MKLKILEKSSKSDDVVKYVLLQTKKAIDNHLKGLIPKEREKISKYLGEPLFAEPIQKLAKQPSYKLIPNKNIWNVYTNTGRLIETRVGSLNYLVEILREISQPLNLQKSLSLLEKVENMNINGHDKTILHALHNVKQILNLQKWEELENNINRGFVSVYIIPSEKYEEVAKKYSSTYKMHNWGETIDAMTFTHRPKLVSSVHEVPVVVRIPRRNGEAVVIARDTPSGVSEIRRHKLNHIINLDLERRLTHELLHVIGLGNHLPQALKEGVVEYFTIKAFTIGEEIRKENADIFFDSYWRIISVIETTSKKLVENGVSEITIQNFLTFGADDKEETIIYENLKKLFGKKGLEKLIRWEFKDATEAYKWVKRKLS